MAELNSTDPRARSAQVPTPGADPSAVPLSWNGSNLPTAPVGKDGKPAPAGSPPPASFERQQANKYVASRAAAPAGDPNVVDLRAQPALVQQVYTQAGSAPSTGNLTQPAPETAKDILRAAGQAPPSPAAQQKINEKVPESDPRYKALASTVAGAVQEKDPAKAAANAKKIHKQASDLGADYNVNAWGLVLKALAGAAKDAQADQSLRIKKLQTLSAIQQGLQFYGERLQKVTQELDAKIGTGKKADQNAQVSFPDQLSFPNLENLTKDGSVVTKKLVDDQGDHKKGSDFNLKSEGDGSYTFNNPNGAADVVIKADNVDDARQQAVNQYNQTVDTNNNNNKKSLVNSSALSSLQQRYTQSLDQLNNKIQQASSDLQNSVQTQQTQYGTATSIIKTIGDLGGSLARNLLS